MLLLLLEVGIQIVDVTVKFSLVILMFSLLSFNLRSDTSDSLMKLDSYRLRCLVSIIMSIDIKLVIVNDGAFGVKCNDGCLQSFDFNFLVGNGHLAIVELLLNDNFLVVIRD